MSIFGYGIECRKNGSFYDGKPEIVEVTDVERTSEKIIGCITYKCSDGMYLSPEDLYWPPAGYGFKLDAAGKMERTVREIDWQNYQQGENIYWNLRPKKFTLCQSKYKFTDPNSAPANVAKIMGYTQYVYALVPKEWITSDDLFRGGRKKKRKPTKRKSTRRRSTKRRSKQRKYKKTRRRR